MATMSKSTSLIDKALAFCAGKFGGAQPVGDAGAWCVPDRTELIRILQEEGGESDPFLTVAALLRQTIQLTSTSDEEIAQAFGFCGRSQWRDGRGGQGKAGGLRIQRTEFAHEIVHNAARRATTEQIGQSGVLR
jgi:hypothetical protein